MRQKQAGFTLLEAMVALVVLGLILGVAATAMSGMGRTRARIGAIADQTGDLALVRDVLRRQVGRALPLTRTDGDQELFDFTARSDHFAFSLVDAPLPGRGGVAAAEFVVEPSPGGQRLIYRQRRSGGAAYETVLADGDYRFHLSYRGDDPREGWRDDWDHNRRWPRLVRLSVGLPGRSAPTIVVPVRADTDRGCVLSLGEGFCRDHPG